jgi:inner membrane protein
LPSPIIHTTLGYIIYRVFRNRVPGKFDRIYVSLPLVLIFAIGVSLLPDFDSIAGILMGDFAKYHNNATHSLSVAVLMAFILAISIRLIVKTGFWIWFAIGFLGYSLHVVMDYFTYGGRGVMLFWPVTLTRYEAPVKLFYGVRWSGGLLNSVHINTFVTEMVFVLLVAMVFLVVDRRRTSISNNKRIPGSLD